MIRIVFSAVAAGTRTGLRVAGSVLGAVAAAVDIADMIYTWVNTDPNLTKANEIIEKLSDEIKSLRKEQSWLKKIEQEILNEISNLDVCLSPQEAPSSSDSRNQCPICLEDVS